VGSSPTWPSIKKDLPCVGLFLWLVGWATEHNATGMKRFGRAKALAGMYSEKAFAAERNKVKRSHLAPFYTSRKLF
jgi:hypothetical protein